MSNRFWSKVDKDGPVQPHCPELGPCWEWTGSRSPAGYGQTRIFWKLYAAHRVSWEKSNGPIPDGLRVLHKCDNPPCIRPDHLFLGTQSDNMLDAYRKGRHCQGVEHRLAKLNPHSVRLMRRLSARGLSFSKLARVFGVSTMTAHQAVRRRTWKHVE